MKLFQIIQSKFAVLGITQTQSIQKQPFNQKILLAYFIYCFGWISSAVFLFQRANTFEEYTNNIYVTSATAIIIFCFTVVVLKMSKLFGLIEKCEKITEIGKTCDFSNFSVTKMLWKCFRIERI